MKNLFAALFFAVVIIHCSCPEPVSCRFIGRVGQRITFEGDRYVIPASGSVEIISDTHNGCESKPRAFRVINRETLKDAKFGTWVMKLPEVKR